MNMPSLLSAVSLCRLLGLAAMAQAQPAPNPLDDVPDKMP